MTKMININCIHFANGRCAHPFAWRTLMPNKPCIFVNGDYRIGSCDVQVKRQAANPPPAPPPKKP